LPKDPQTFVDYGFARTCTGYDRSDLLQLYAELLLVQKVSPRTLHKWRIEGRLVEMIKESYEKLPPENRGGYYPWFLNNQYVFDHSMTPPTDLVHDGMV